MFLRQSSPSTFWHFLLYENVTSLFMSSRVNLKWLKEDYKGNERKKKRLWSIKELTFMLSSRLTASMYDVSYNDVSPAFADWSIVLHEVAQSLIFSSSSTRYRQESVSFIVCTLIFCSLGLLNDLQNVLKYLKILNFKYFGLWIFFVHCQIVLKLSNIF